VFSKITAILTDRYQYQ